MMDKSDQIKLEDLYPQSQDGSGPATPAQKEVIARRLRQYNLDALSNEKKAWSVLWICCKDCRWRTAYVTDKQRYVLNLFGLVKYATCRGKASDLIAAVYALPEEEQAQLRELNDMRWCRPSAREEHARIAATLLGTEPKQEPQHATTEAG